MLSNLAARTRGKHCDLRHHRSPAPVGVNVGPVLLRSGR
jgi:hypothetical protein